MVNLAPQRTRPAGLRRGEVMTLDLADVDLAVRTVAVIGKGKSEKVRNREQILPTGVPEFLHPIAAQHPLLDLVAGVPLVADVLIVSLGAQRQADLITLAVVGCGCSLLINLSLRGIIHLVILYIINIKISKVADLHCGPITVE